MTGKELIDMLMIIKEQAIKSNNDTAIIDIKIDSFNFVIGETIKALEQEPKTDTLDKIRAVIEQLRLYKAQFLTDGKKICIDSQEVLDIIDRFKAESEEV